MFFPEPSSARRRLASRLSHFGLPVVVVALGVVACQRTPESPRPAAIVPSTAALPAPSAPPPATRIEIPLPDGPPRQDAIEGGTYVLSLSIELDNGGSVQKRHVCAVTVDGATVAVRVERSTGAPFAGTLAGGRLTLTVTEGQASYSLEGQVTGPGRLAGRVIEATALEGAHITDGRWALQRVK